MVTATKLKTTSKLRGVRPRDVPGNNQRGEEGKPFVAACLIVRDSSKSLGNCLKSLKEGVDFINITDTGSVDDTKKIIKETLRGFPHQLTDFVWVEDFSAARNFNLAQLPSDAEWFIWVDSDDILEGASRIKEVIASMPQDAGAIWLPYNYAQDEFGNCTTTFERERILKVQYNWIWQSRLHETVQPLTPCKYYRDGRIVVRHSHSTTGSRSDRNFKLLNLMLKEEPHNKRVWLYLGHQHFADGSNMEAAEWYLKFSACQDVQPIERYQTLIYAARALRKMQDYSQAITCDLTAMDLYPEWADAYIWLAVSCNAMGQYEKAISWATQARSKRAPDPLIFINPMEYNFSVPVILAEAYLKMGRYADALREYQAAYAIRPLPDIKYNLEAIQEGNRREEAVRSMKVLAVALLENKELLKVAKLPDIAPFWMRESQDYAEIAGGAAFHTKDMKDQPLILETNEGVIVNIDKSLDPEKLLASFDQRQGVVTVVSTMPAATQDRYRVLSPTEMERLVTSVPGRRIIDLQYEPDKIWCKYDHKVPEGIKVRIFCGQGLEHWSLKSIKEVGCGGSETWAAYMAMELAAQGCDPHVYAMDTQVYNGTTFRSHTAFKPEAPPSHLFISSRVPDVLHLPVVAMQKWLWTHDVHNGERLTPEIAEKLDAIVCLSHWHAGHLKRCYQWLADCSVVDMDCCLPTYEDGIVLGGPFHVGAQLFRKPKLAIIGNGIDASRFEGLDLSHKKPHSFAWVSSPDRGLAQVLDMWPLILEAFPDATLNIYYGWEYFDSTLGIPGQRELKVAIQEKLRQRGVTWKGRVGQVQLAQELAATDVWLYPPNHDFRETFCISALEMQAAGVLCFYRQSGALGETIGAENGVPLPLQQDPKETVATILKVLSNQAMCDTLRANGRTHALRRSWAAQAQKVLSLYRLIESGQGV